MTAILEQNDCKKKMHEFRVPACPPFVQSIVAQRHFRGFDSSCWILQQNKLTMSTCNDHICTLVW